MLINSTNPFGSVNQMRLSNVIKDQWLQFERWLPGPRAAKEQNIREINKSYVDELERTKRTAPGLYLARKEDLDLQKQAALRAVERETTTLLREEWESRLNEAGLNVEDWVMTQREMAAVESVLGGLDDGNEHEPSPEGTGSSSTGTYAHPSIQHKHVEKQNQPPPGYAVVSPRIFGMGEIEFEEDDHNSEMGSQIQIAETGGRQQQSFAAWASGVGLGYSSSAHPPTKNSPPKPAPPVDGPQRWIPDGLQAGPSKSLPNKAKKSQPMKAATPQAAVVRDTPVPRPVPTSRQGRATDASAFPSSSRLKTHQDSLTAAPAAITRVDPLSHPSEEFSRPDIHNLKTASQAEMPKSHTSFSAVERKVSQERGSADRVTGTEHHDVERPSASKSSADLVQVSSSSSSTAAKPSKNGNVRPKTTSRYVGPILVDPNSSDCEHEEAEFERFKLEARCQKIREFHLLAIDIAVELAVKLSDRSLDKRKSRKLVEEHETHMLELQEIKEEERKAIVDTERAKRRSEFVKKRRGKAASEPEVAVVGKGKGGSEIVAGMPNSATDRVLGESGTGLEVGAARGGIFSSLSTISHALGFSSNLVAEDSFEDRADTPDIPPLKDNTIWLPGGHPSLSADLPQSPQVSRKTRTHFIQPSVVQQRSQKSALVQEEKPVWGRPYRGSEPKPVAPVLAVPSITHESFNLGRSDSSSELDGDTWSRVKSEVAEQQALFAAARVAMLSSSTSPERSRRLSLSSAAPPSSTTSRITSAQVQGILKRPVTGQKMYRHVTVEEVPDTESDEIVHNAAEHPLNPRVLLEPRSPSRAPFVHPTLDIPITRERSEESQVPDSTESSNVTTPLSDAEVNPAIWYPKDASDTESVSNADWTGILADEGLPRVSADHARWMPPGAHSSEGFTSHPSASTEEDIDIFTKMSAFVREALPDTRAVPIPVPSREPPQAQAERPSAPLTKSTILQPTTIPNLLPKPVEGIKAGVSAKGKATANPSGVEEKGGKKKRKIKAVTKGKGQAAVGISGSAAEDVQDETERFMLQAIENLKPVSAFAV